MKPDLENIFQRLKKVQNDLDVYYAMHLKEVNKLPRVTAMDEVVLESEINTVHTLAEACDNLEESIDHIQAVCKKISFAFTET